jgi:hypothetical protein
MPDNVGHFVETAIVHPVHAVQYPPLHGLKPIFYGWHGPFQDYIAGIV